MIHPRRLEELGAVEDLHGEGNGGDISPTGGFGCAGTASDDAADAAEGVATQDRNPLWWRTRPRSCQWEGPAPLPQLLVLAGEIVTGKGGDVICLADGRTSLGAVLEDNQARFAAGVLHGRGDEGALGDMAFEHHEAVSGEFEGRRAGWVHTDLVPMLTVLLR